jgi:16S rRNA (cytidine1402-2'-O)-methyltransferase
MEQNPKKLYIVPTPIGNLQDITFRAIEVLKSVDYIAAEDKRVTGILLKHFDIHTPMINYHQHNENHQGKNIVELILQGKSIAIVSDAGTPGISDSVYEVVNIAIEKGIFVETLPGAVAFIPALINSGFPTHRFAFEGFLPLKKGRKTRWQMLQKEERTIILYESPHRLLRTLQEIEFYLGKETKISISREISKLFEETLRGTVTQLIQHFEHKKPKGEFVIVLHKTAYQNTDEEST